MVLINILRLMTNKDTFEQHCYIFSKQKILYSHSIYIQGVKSNRSRNDYHKTFSSNSCRADPKGDIRYYTKTYLAVISSSL